MPKAKEVYVTVRIPNEGYELKFYVCSRISWEQTDEGERAREIIDRLRTTGICVDVEGE